MSNSRIVREPFTTHLTERGQIFWASLTDTWEIGTNRCLDLKTNANVDPGATWFMMQGGGFLADVEITPFPFFCSALALICPLPRFYNFRKGAFRAAALIITGELIKVEWWTLHLFIEWRPERPHSNEGRRMHPMTLLLLFFFFVEDQGCCTQLLISSLNSISG